MARLRTPSLRSADPSTWNVIVDWSAERRPTKWRASQSYAGAVAASWSSPAFQLASLVGQARIWFRIGAFALLVIAVMASSSVADPSFGRLYCTAPKASVCCEDTATRRPPGLVSGAGAACPPAAAKLHQATFTGSSAEGGEKTAPVATRPIDADVAARASRVIQRVRIDARVDVMRPPSPWRVSCVCGVVPRPRRCCG